MGKNKKINKILHIKRIKGIIEEVKNFINDNKYILWLCVPFILMEVFTFVFCLNISFINYRIYAPILFSALWIILFVGVSISFRGKISKFIYLTINLIFLALFLVNNVYFSMTQTFFDFNLLESAGEGAPYLLDAIRNCNIFVYISFIIILITLVYAFKKVPSFEKNNYKLLVIVIFIFIIGHSLTPLTLGKANDELTWSNWRNARNIYNSFNDSNKSIKITGFFEYSIRNFYITYIRKEANITQEDIEFLNTAFADTGKHNNNYTGMFKDKNLILIQLEGMDSWLINKNDTPTLYNMMNSGINFSNHYSYYNGGGSTFNSEFAVNTGFITPLSYTKNAYTFNKNNFPYSLANLFKAQNYSVNAFHMNNGEYYSRTVNYLNWGYDNYYGLIDIDDYDDNSYELDRELILNEKFNELLFNEDGNFLDYIITYSGHLPFTNTKGVCKTLYNMDIDEIKIENPNLEIEFVEMTEEECVRRQAQETDYMVELLIKNLEERQMLENTAIVVFTDHYLYTLEDKTILDKYKNTSNNLINNTPFFIWSTDIEKTNIREVTSQLNILPTVLNLFGIEYNANNYIAQDALDPSYKGLVFFSDYSWYDRDYYVDGGLVTNNKYIDPLVLEEKNNYVNYLTKKNDLALKYNYFKNIKKKKPNNKEDNKNNTPTSNDNKE